MRQSGLRTQNRRFHDLMKWPCFESQPVLSVLSSDIDARRPVPAPPVPPVGVGPTPTTPSAAMTAVWFVRRGHVSAPSAKGVGWPQSPGGDRPRAVLLPSASRSLSAAGPGPAAGADPDLHRIIIMPDRTGHLSSSAKS